MPKYLVSGKDHRDRRATEAVAAPNSDEAVRRFAARGYTDVVLHSDEVIAHLFQPKALEHLTPRDYLAIGRVGRFGMMWRLIVRLYRQQWWLFGVMLALVIGRRVLESEWDFLDWMATLFLASPV